MRTMRNALLAVALAAIGSSCTDLTGLGPMAQSVLRHRLAQAEARWAAQGSDDYVVTLRRLCYCGEIEPRRITVIDGVVTDVRIVGSDTALPEDQWQWYPSVTQLFAITREAIERPAHQLETLYDAESGFSTRVAIDWDMNIADEEVTFEVTALESLVFVLDRVDARRY